MTTFGSDIAENVLRMTESIEVSVDGTMAIFRGEEFHGHNAAMVAAELWPTVYHSCHIGSPTKPEMFRSLRDENLEIRLRDVWDEQRVIAVPVLRKLPEGDFVIELSGVKLRIPTSHPALLDVGENTVDIAVSALRPALSPGFLLAASAKPIVSHGSLLRVYARIDDTDTAPATWRTLVEYLENTVNSWQAKICSMRALYPKNDAIVVYLPRSGWRHARRCAELLQSAGALGEQTSIFTQRLTAGVSCAFEPSDSRPQYQRLSFGQHRARICTEAAIAFHTRSDGPDSTDMATLLESHFLAADVDPTNPARNMSSPVVDVLGIG
jgi:hypothetical protein